MTPFEPIADQLIEAIEAAKISKAIGGFDITLNEHQKGKFAPHWQPHAWILVPEKGDPTPPYDLQEAFPEGHPHRVQTGDDQEVQRKSGRDCVRTEGGLLTKNQPPKSSQEGWERKKPERSLPTTSSSPEIGTDVDARSDWSRKAGVPLWRRGDRSTERLSDLTDTSETIDTAYR